MFPDTHPLPLETVVEPYGKIAMVGITGGERYYWLVNDEGVVSMMPYFVIEQPAESE